MKKIFIAIFTIFFLQLNAANSAVSNWQENQSKGAKTQLLASFYQNEKGEKKLIAAINFKIADGWKIYGNDSGGIGLPPSLDFTGSNNVASHQIIWPTPIAEEEKIGDEIIKFSSYKKEVLLPIEIELQNPNQPTNLTIKLNYGLCKDVCIPAEEIFSLEVLSEIDNPTLEEIQKFLPQKISNNVSEAKKAPPLFLAVLLAIIGGLILNIMPCVLPVLSIKLISVINHSNASISRIRFAFFSTILGILFCFLILALAAVLIKITGNSLGWGLQFQNPYFLIFLNLILVFFIGNLLGLFEINFSQILATILNKKISQGEEKHNIFLPNFFSGILAVLLATPCSAPFLGAAISFALVQSSAIIFLMFLAIGVGFASPYFVLILAPKLVYFLPKPGNWMNKAKQLMAGFLAATVIWLIYILANNIGAGLAFLIAFFSMAILGCIKIKSFLLRYLAIITLIIAAFALPLEAQKTSTYTTNPHQVFWTEFDEAKIYEEVAKGKVVVVDVTADWCITCKFNKLRVFRSKEIITRINDDQNIVAMQADITKPNAKVITFLHTKNRFAIPFNAVYGPNAKDGLLTSELLSKKELLELIEKAK
jgi:suppressor for copper-sensitivity B